MQVHPQKYLHRLKKDNEQFTLVCVFVYFALFVYM